MSLTNEAESNLLLLLFENTTWANVGDATGIVGSTGAGSLYISLHTSDPGETGSQTTNEASYTSYARVAVARSSSGFTVSGTTQVANAAAVTFPTSTGGSNTVTHVGVGTASSGAAHLIGSLALTSSRAVASGDTPSFATGTLIFTAD